MRTGRFCSGLAVMLGITLAGSPAQGRQPPLWELGVGFTVLETPDYRGADERQLYAFPFPYLIYRGDFLRVNGDDIRGRIFETDRVELDLSLAAGPPVDSDDNDARASMPDLDPIVEIGPSLRITLAGKRDSGQWLLRLPIRKVTATDLSDFEDAGWTFSPHLQYQHGRFGADNWSLGVAAGPIFASEQFHDYYYGVAPAFARSGRPAYDGSGGYSGSRITVTVNKRFNHHWIGAFARYDELSGAAFEDSPLVRQEHSLMVGAAITWFFARSSRPAPAR